MRCSSTLALGPQGYNLSKVDENIGKPWEGSLDYCEHPEMRGGDIEITV